MDIYTFPSFHPSFSSLFSSCSLSVFCLPAPLNHHKSCHWLTSSLSLSVCLYSLFVAAQQSILFKETPEKWDTCLSTHTHTDTHSLTRKGIIIMDAHGLTREREKEREMDVYFLLGFRLFDWTDEWLHCVCVSFSLFLSFVFDMEKKEPEEEVEKKEKERQGENESERALELGKQ